MREEDSKARLYYLQETKAQNWSVRQLQRQIETRTTAIDLLEAELDRQITRYNSFHQATLAAAFSGSL